MKIPQMSPPRFRIGYPFFLVQVQLYPKNLYPYPLLNDEVYVTINEKSASIYTNMHREPIKDSGETIIFTMHLPSKNLILIKCEEYVMRNNTSLKPHFLAVEKL